MEPASDAERIAQAFHEAYEGLAPSHGYETREASARPWTEVPERNRSLMIATVQRLLDSSVITRAPRAAVRDSPSRAVMLVAEDALAELNHFAPAAARLLRDRLENARS